MLDEFMRTSNLIQGDNFGNIESRPSCLERLINITSGLNLCLAWHVIAAHEEDCGVHEYKLPEGNLRRGSSGRICRNGTTLRQ